MVARSTLWRRANPERASEHNKRSYRRHHASVRARQKSHRLQHRYGITQHDYDLMWTAQCGLCAICGRRRKLVVDHCHASQAVRGLLCVGCNLRLSGIEKAGWLDAALSYLGVGQ